MSGQCYKLCEYCGKPFSRNPKESKKQQQNRRFCSCTCAARRNTNGWRKTSTGEIIEMYKQGKSTYELAKIFGMEQNSIVVLLRFHGVMKKGVGTIAEDLVEELFIEMGYKVKRMRGDYKYDMLVNGEKVDVKYTAKNNHGYSFNLQTHPNHRNFKRWKKKNKVIEDEIDWLALVFGDTGDVMRFNTYSKMPAFGLLISGSGKNISRCRYLGTIDSNKLKTVK